VDTSAQWNPSTGTGHNYFKFGEGKADGFNLDVVQLTIAKPLDEAEWAVGYRADLWFGPDANTLNTTSTGDNTSDMAVRQAYIALRMPVGNGIDWKMGVFDSPIGYESLEAGNNPNWTRSYGHSLEPQTLTGLQASYRLSDAISFGGGIADSIGSTINGRSNPPKAESFKTYMGTIALTAPESWVSLRGQPSTVASSTATPAGTACRALFCR
jgi:long-subunit fatty acid transport protein